MTNKPKRKKPDKYAPDSDFVRNLEHDIVAFIEAGVEQPDTDKRFNELALRLFEYQYNMNPPYQKYCDKRGMTPGDISSWEKIPAVPTDAFKEVDLCTFPSDDTVKIIESSGTKDQTRRSKVHMNDMGVRLVDLSYKSSIEGFFYPSGERDLHALVMGPPLHLLPSNSSGAYGMKKVIEGYCAGEPEYFVGREGLDFERLAASCREAEERGQPVMIVGITFAFAHFFEFCKAKGLSFNLPQGSRIIHGGGFKGKSKELGKDEFAALTQEMTGIPPEYNLNNYALTEVQAVFADNVLRNHVKGIEEKRYKVNPAWTRTIAVNPETLEPLPKGKQGLLRHYCLANINTVVAVQTDDVGYEMERGFEIIGRAEGAESRGCSIAVDELLNAQTK